MLGDPAWMPHPVVCMGKAISALETLAAPRFPQDTPRAAGGGCGAGGSCCRWARLTVTLRAVVAVRPGAPGAVALRWRQLWCWQALAVRGLRDESRNVYRALTGDDAARERAPAVARIVGRDTPDIPQRRRRDKSRGGNRGGELLRRGGRRRLFYMLLGGAPLALCYKAINTMDSMVGYKNERYLYFGRAAARLDDAANYLPARLSALLLIAAAALHGAERAGRAAHLAAGPAQPCKPQFRPDGGGHGRGAGRAAGRAGLLFRQAATKSPTIGDALRPVEPAGHPAGKPDAVCRGHAVLALLALALRAGRAACTLGQ